MDASCKIQRSIHDVRLTYKYVSRILGTYHYSAIRDYKKFNFDTLSVSRRVIDGKVVSKSVSYVIRIIGTDISGHKKINTIFMICSSESGILSEPINGCNAIDIAYCKSAAAIKEYICNSLHIQENIIDVKQIGKGGLA